jgi:hypothetical protein
MTAEAVYQDIAHCAKNNDAIMHHTKDIAGLTLCNLKINTKIGRSGAESQHEREC